MAPLFAFFDSPPTLIILGVLAVLLFGERLPDVARSIGKGLMELKKGVRGIQDEIQGAIDSAGSSHASASADREPSPYHEPHAAHYGQSGPSPYGGSDDREEATSPKFEPPPSSSQ